MDLEAEKRALCKEQHGFFLQRGPGDSWYVTIPSGVDPSDGSPLWYLTQATPFEADLWVEGRLPTLARLVAERSPVLLRPTPPPVKEPAPAQRVSRWSRCIEWLRQALWASRN